MLIEFIKPDFEFEDSRGSLKQLVHKGWNQINYITSVADAFRGNHYHKLNKEAFFIIKGSLKLSVSTLDNVQHEEYNIKTGDCFIIYPNINHSFHFTEDTALISMYDKGVERPDGQKDILQVKE